MYRKHATISVMTSINNKDKIIYIHIPKCAGSSIEKNSWMGGAGHVTYKHILKSKNINHYFVFTSVRNPYDRLVSSYFHYVKWNFRPNEPKIYHKYNKIIQKYYHNFKDKKLQGFPEFIADMTIKPVFNLNHFRPQTYFVADYKNTIPMDFIIKFETLQQDFDQVCDILHKPRIQLPHVKKTLHKPWQEYYNDTEVKKRIYNMYKADFKNFGYHEDVNI